MNDKRLRYSLIFLITFVTLLFTNKLSYAQIRLPKYVVMPDGHRISKDSVTFLYGNEMFLLEKTAYDTWCKQSVLLLQNLEIAKDIYRRSTLNYAINFPNDTEGIFQKWMEELRLAGSLNKSQTDLILKFESTLKYIIANESKHKLTTLDQFATEFLLTCLPIETYGRLQFNKYRQIRWLEHQASNRLYTHFKKDLNLDEPKIQAELKLLLTR